jgi:hypothetical protein
MSLVSRGGWGDQRRDAGNISPPQHQPEITNWSSSRERSFNGNSAFHNDADKPQRIGGLQVCYRCGSWRYLSGSLSLLLSMRSQLSISRSSIGKCGNFLRGLSLLAPGRVGIFGYLAYRFRLCCHVGTVSVETPEISDQRAIVHAILFLLCFYFGFISKPREHANVG